MAIADNFNTIVTFQKFPNFCCNDLQRHYLFNLWSLKLTIYRKDKSSLHHSIVYLSLVPMTKHLEDCQWWRGWWERSGPDIEAGTNLSLALTHHILNQTVLHLLNVHVHGPGQFLEFDKPEYVMSLRENQPPGTKVGLVTLSGLSESQKFEFSLFPVRYWTKFSTKISYDINNTVSVTLITLKPLDQDKRISADPRWAKFDFVGIRVDVSAL